MNRRGRKFWNFGGRDNQHRSSLKQLRGIPHSPQGFGCFPFFNRRTRGKYNPNRQPGSSILSGVASRLGVPVGRGRGGKYQGRGRGGHQSSRYSYSGQLWYKITIPYGRSFGKEFIMESLSSYVDGELYPLLFKYGEVGDAIFFLEDAETADAVEAASRRVSGPDGRMLIVKKTTAPPPFIPIDQEEEDLIKQVMSTRFDTKNNHLNLSGFALDPVFKSHDRHCSLQRNNIMTAVVKLIGGNCPNVQSIDLSNNRLRFLDYLGSLVYRAKHVERVSLAKNQIERMPELEKLKGWQIVELDLDQNPLCNQYKDKTTYTRSVHKVFPKVRLLDGCAVQPELRFELEDDGPDVVKKAVPKFLPGFYVNDDLRKVVETFTLEYFTIYDSPNANERQKLFQAYEEDALFTLAIEKLDPKASFSDRDVFMEYRRDSHNVKQIEKWEKYRQKLISKGALNVVARLTRLPKTKHLIHSFLVDVSFAAETVMCFTVQGMFRDGGLAETEGDELKFFSRTFLVIPKGEGKIAIVNDELFMSPFSKDQVDSYQRMLQKAVNEQNKQIQEANPEVPGPSGVTQVPRPVMVEKFAAESGMKPMWAEKCLEDNEWSYEKAAQVFLEMKAKNVIPSEAFA